MAGTVPALVAHAARNGTLIGCPKFDRRVEGVCAPMASIFAMVNRSVDALSNGCGVGLIRSSNRMVP